MNAIIMLVIIGVLAITTNVEAAPIKTKVVCYTRVDKANKPVKQCKTIKIHRKLSGTKIPQ